MCPCCSVSSRKYWMYGCTTFTVLIALIVGLLWPTLFVKVLYSKLELRNGSESFNNWIETPLPMYLEFQLFNWTNAAQVADHSVKPHFAELGPYVFREHHRREAVVWHPENGTVSFNQTRVWHFVPEMSVGSLDDRVTTVNVIAASAAYAARDFDTIMKIGLNFIMKTRAEVMVTKTVREFLFDGYDDALLNFIRDAKLPGVDVPPFDRFAWFYARNNSASYDGRVNMYTGGAVGDAEDPMLQMGNIYTWNGANRTNFFRNECSRVHGSTGELWHPKLDRTQPLEIFATDVCRSLPLTYASEAEILGVPGARWVGDDRMLDNGLKYPEMACYCESEAAKCPDLMPGVVSVSECRYGAPAFVSYPHFYLADESYRAAIEGMRPNRSEHEFGMTLEPSTGIPLQVEARLQINILLQPIDKITLYENVPKVMVPMMWFTQRAAITEDLAGQVRTLVIAPGLGVYVAYGVGALGVILLLVSIILTVTRSWGEPGMTSFTNEDDNDDELRR